MRIIGFDGIARGPETGGGAGSAAATATAAGAPPSPPAAGAGAPPPPAGGAATAPGPGAPSPEAGGQAAGNAPAGAPYRPDGLPDNLVGASDRETIDALTKAVKGYRDRDATRDVPPDAKGYLEFTDVPEATRPYFEDLKDDPLFARAAAVAHTEGIGKAAFTKMLAAAFEGGLEAGLFEAPVDKAAERAALLPEAAKGLPKSEQDAAIDRRLSDNLAWVTQMQARGLPKDAADHMVMMLGDSAKGHRAIEWFRGQMEGGGPRPLGGGAAGGTETREALQAALGLPKHDPRHVDFDAESYRALREKLLALSST